MKRNIYSAAVVFLMLFSTGCIETHLLVRVQPDGSGTVQETVDVTMQPLIMFFQSLQQMATEDGEAPVPFFTDEELFSDEDIRQRAASYGNDVHYLSHQRHETGEKIGYTAEFGFTDINVLRLNISPGSSLPDLQGQGAEQEERNEEMVAFSFTQGSPSRLIIKTPFQGTGHKSKQIELKVRNSGEDSGDRHDSETLEEIKHLLSEMRLSLRIQIDGDIVSTNATYRDADVITMIDLDFSRLLENEDVLRRLEENDNLTLMQIKDLLVSIPGLVYEMGDEIEVLMK